MKDDFDDITSRIKEEPTWYDQNGTPRYGKFLPQNTPDIYADQALLIRISCQNCHKKFLVSMNYGRMDELYERFSIGPFQTNRAPHYGDPPAHGCVGNTMNCEDSEIVEFWEKSEKKGKNYLNYVRLKTDGTKNRSSIDPEEAKKVRKKIDGKVR